jgi:hypothetical protein
LLEPPARGLLPGASPLSSPSPSPSLCFGVVDEVVVALGFVVEECDVVLADDETVDDVDGTEVEVDVLTAVAHAAPADSIRIVVEITTRSRRFIAVDPPHHCYVEHSCGAGWRDASPSSESGTLDPRQ